MNKAILPIALLMLGSLAACAGPHQYYGRIPPPPPPRYGAYGYAPGPGYVWTDGFWDLRGSRWVWVSGRWLRPPRPRAMWVPGHWKQYGNGYRFNRGYWR